MRFLSLSHSLWRALGAAALVAAMAWPALAEDRPDSGRRSEAPENIPQIDSPVPDDAKRPQSDAELVQRDLAAISPDDRGSTYTDGSEGRENGGLNPVELTKLEVARAAVEASRSNGTLYGAAPVDLTRPDNAEELKLERLCQQQPGVVGQPDASGVLNAPRPVQEVGPAELNAHERAKLEGDLQGAPDTAEPESRRIDASRAADTENARQNEEGR